MTLTLDSFSYDDDLHVYRNAEGLTRPSVTQTLKAGGLFNYDRIPVDLLAAKCALGSNVHAWTAAYDRGEHGREDTLHLSDREEGYALGWPKFVDALGEHEWLSIEQPMMRTIGGLQVGGTADRKVRIGRRIFILDIKCVSSFDPAWRLQLADYVMMDTGRLDCSMYGRAIVLLHPNSTFNYHQIDPSHDALDSQVATAFIQTYVWRKNHNKLHIPA
jgi:hypothetical protein